MKLAFVSNKFVLGRWHPSIDTTSGAHAPPHAKMPACYRYVDMAIRETAERYQNERKKTTKEEEAPP
jgi:hypothetical protein